MIEQPYNVLFLCTGNSARSILAESVLNRAGAGRFHAFSAGSTPTGRVQPEALELLERLGYPTRELRSKSWSEFATAGAPVMNFVFTVCDRAANEACPVWPGRPMSAHWSIPDPAAVSGTDAERHLAYADAYRLLRNRIGAFVSLPISSLQRLSLEQALDRIGSLS